MAPQVCRFWATALFLLLLYVDVSIPQCTTSRENQYMIRQFPGAVAYSDENIYPDFVKWGYFCCNSSPNNFTATLRGNTADFEEQGTCNPAGSDDVIQFKVEKNPSLEQGCITAYVSCEISFQGNLTHYLDRQKPCTYAPLISLSCGPGSVAETLRSREVRFLDENVPPTWSTDSVAIEISEHTPAGTVVLDSRSSGLSVWEPTDIWGSSNWNVTLRVEHTPFITDDVLSLDETLSIFADPNIPPSRLRSVPALRLARTIPYNSCHSMLTPCTFEIDLVATDGSGSTSSAKVILKVIDENDHPPIFSEDFISITVDEDHQTGETWPLLSAFDQDLGINCALLYTIDQSANWFTVDAATGQLGVLGGALKWSEGNDTHIFRVRVTEDETSGAKCSSKMTSVATVVVKVTSQRSSALVITTVPSILTARRYVTDEQKIGNISFQRNKLDVEVGSLRIAVTSNADIVAVIAGQIIKRQGARITEKIISFDLEIRDGLDRVWTTSTVSIVGEDGPLLQFTQPLYEYGVYAGENLTLTPSDRIVNCETCGCSFRNLDPTTPDTVQTAAGMVISLESWEPWVASNGIYRSDFVAECTSAVNRVTASAVFIINWHPLPQFAVPKILVRENTKPGESVGMVRPLSAYPYPLIYTTASDSPLGIDSNTGILSLLTPLDFDTQRIYHIEVMARLVERTQTMVFSVPVEVLDMVVPARFVATSPIDTNCDGPVEIQIAVGEEQFAMLKFNVLGENGQCVQIRKNPEVASVSLIPVLAEDCREIMSVVTSLEGPKSFATLIVHFTGCATIPGTTNPQPPTNQPEVSDPISTTLPPNSFTFTPITAGPETMDPGSIASTTVPCVTTQCTPCEPCPSPQPAITELTITPPQSTLIPHTILTEVSVTTVLTTVRPTVTEITSTVEPVSNTILTAVPDTTLPTTVPPTVTEITSTVEPVSNTILTAVPDTTLPTTVRPTVTEITSTVEPVSNTILTAVPDTTIPTTVRSTVTEITSTVTGLITDTSTLPTNSTGPADEPMNLLSRYIDVFNISTKEYFGFDATSKELQIKDMPPPETTYHLGFLPGVVQQFTRAAKDSTNPAYVLTVRVLSKPPPAVIIIGTTEIILIVIASLLLIAVFVIMFGAAKMRRNQKKIKSVASRNISLGQHSTPEGIIRFSATPKKSNTSTIIRIHGSASGESETGNIFVRKRDSLHVHESEPDRLNLVENESMPENESGDFSTHEPMQEPDADYDDLELQPNISSEQTSELKLAIPTTSENSGETTSTNELEKELEKEIIKIPEAEGITPATLVSRLSQAPPPPIRQESLLSKGPRQSSAENLLQKKTEPTGNFMEELKSVVGDPYKVLKPRREESVIEPSNERKVRFDGAVEVFPASTLLVNGSTPPSSSSSPVIARVQPGKLEQPELASPSYSPMPKYNFGGNTLVILSSPPTPDYKSPLNLAKYADAKSVSSQNVPVYSSTPLNAWGGAPQLADSVNGVEETSRRQMPKNRLDASPPLPPPPPSKQTQEESNEPSPSQVSPEDEQKSDEEDIRTAL